MSMPPAPWATSGSSWGDISASEDAKDGAAATGGGAELAENAETAEAAGSSSQAAAGEPKSGGAPAAAPAAAAAAADAGTGAAEEILEKEGPAGGAISSFRELTMLREELHLGIERELQFEEPFAIQCTKLPEILADPRRHCIAQAPSGSGKTVCFVLGMLHRIDTSVDEVQAVCMVPGREIARQIYDQCVEPMARHMRDLKVRLVLAGDRDPRPVTEHLVIGTPGALGGANGKIEKKKIRLRSCRVFVLDEADKMITKERGGFRKETLRVISALDTGERDPRRGCQVLMFSATFTKDVVKLANKLLKTFRLEATAGEGPAEAAAPRDEEVFRIENKIPTLVKQIRVDTRRVRGENGRFELLKAIYEVISISQTMIFCATKRMVNDIARLMAGEKFSTRGITGDLLPEQRDACIRDFRNGDFKILVTTNVIARGLDVQGVNVVVNYDPPSEADGSPAYDDYQHRVGRCGRAGRFGTAINFICSDEHQVLMDKFEERFGPSEAGGPIITDLPVFLAAKGAEEVVDEETLDDFRDRLEEIVTEHKGGIGQG